MNDELERIWQEAAYPNLCTAAYLALKKWANHEKPYPG
jgi:hypothetical protein